MTDPDRRDPRPARAGPPGPLPLTDAELDGLLRSAPDPAPADFADRLLRRLDAAPATPALHAAAVPATSRWRGLAERAALVAAAALGIGQVLAFIFGLWAATAAAAA